MRFDAATVRDSPDENAVPGLPRPDIAPGAICRTWEAKDNGVNKKDQDKDKQMEDVPSKDKASSEQQKESSILQTAAAHTSLGESFKTRFEVIPALNDALKDEVYRLRHSVYCEDLQWEAIRPSGQESDEYDTHSVHILLRHVTTRENVGCVRMVLTRPNDPAFRLPFERVCDGKLYTNGVKSDSLPRDKMAEISRLAIISKYRRRQGEAMHPPATTQDLAPKQSRAFRISWWGSM
jgi:hypothetical protein